MQERGWRTISFSCKWGKTTENKKKALGKRFLFYFFLLCDWHPTVNKDRQVKLEQPPRMADDSQLSGNLKSFEGPVLNCRDSTHRSNWSRKFVFTRSLFNHRKWEVEKLREVRNNNNTVHFHTVNNHITVKTDSRFSNLVQRQTTRLYGHWVPGTFLGPL